MDKESHIKIRKKIVDQMLNKDVDPATFTKLKVWHSSTKTDFNSIQASLAHLNFVILFTFGIEDDESCKSVFLLCLTPEKHECLIIVPQVECSDSIIIRNESASLVPYDIKTNFIESLKNSSTAIAFLTHHGIDGVGNSGNYSYDDQEVALKSLDRGTKFYMPLPLVDYDNLVSITANNNISTFVNQSSETTLFKQMIYKSNTQGLLDSNGPYTVFAPRNKVLEKYSYLLDNGNEVLLKAFVLNHVFKGIYDKQFTGKLTSLQGNEYDNTDLQSHNYWGDFYKANGLISISNIVLEPTINLNKDVIIPMSETVSSQDIAETSYDIWRVQNMTDKTVRQELKDYLSLITSALAIQENFSNGEMKITGDKIVSLDDKLQEIIYEMEVVTTEGKFEVKNNITQEMKLIQEELAKLNAEYGEYMRTSYRLTALKYLLAIAAKIARDS